MKYPAFFLIGVLALAGTMVFAHAPVTDDAGVGAESATLETAVLLDDPSQQSLAIYGSLVGFDEIDLYRFEAAEEQVMPFELFVPVRKGLQAFRPSLAVIGSDVESHDRALLPFEIEEDFGIHVITAPSGERGIFYEEYGQESLWQNREEKLRIATDTTYYVAVWEPNGVAGDYSLGIGTVENFQDANLFALVGEVMKIKLGMHAGKSIPWSEVLALFLMLAGFIVGLGAVTVIDWHGFMATRSAYWTEATIRSHKITKPLIWFGTALAAVGGYLFYRPTGLSGTALFHLLLLIILVLNGLFLSFVVSPELLKREKAGKAAKLLPKKLQMKIAGSFIISFLGWWTAVFLLAWKLTVLA